jgi:predicted  nucleic acid-binding Zn-ribbon protein
MKIILKAVLLILLLTLTIERSKKGKKHSKAHIEEAVTPCQPGVYDVTVSFGTDLKSSFTARLDARNLASPAGNEVYGLVFTNISGDNGGILTTDNYIDYLLSSSFSSNSPGTSGSTISGTVLVNKVATSFQILFKYDSQWPFITDDNLVKIIGWINSNRSNIQKAVTIQRSIAIATAQNYTDTQTSLSAITKGKDEIDAQITSLTNSIKALNATNINLLGQVQKLQSDIDTQTTNAATYTNSISDKQNSAKSLQAQLISLNSTLINLQQNQISAASISVQLPTYLKTISDQLINYQQEVGSLNQTMMDAFTKTLQINLDLTAFKTAMTTCLT